MTDEINIYSIPIPTIVSRDPVKKSDKDYETLEKYYSF
jgi:hypothetical protein